jgi:hypothetical protein
MFVIMLSVFVDTFMTHNLELKKLLQFVYIGHYNTFQILLFAFITFKNNVLAFMVF